MVCLITSNLGLSISAYGITLSYMIHSCITKDVAVLSTHFIINGFIQGVIAACNMAKGEAGPVEVSDMTTAKWLVHSAMHA